MDDANMDEGTFRRRRQRQAWCQDGKRTDRTEKRRETSVNNGHLRSSTVTRKQVLTWHHML